MSLLDLSGVSAQGDPVPSGQYLTVIEKAELADTRSAGKMIKVQFKIQEGPCENRIVFNQYNIQNASPQATQIGLGQLKQMMTKFGHPNPNQLASTQELVGLRGLIRVKVEEDGQYGPQARITSYATAPTSGPVTGAPSAKTPF